MQNNNDYQATVEAALRAYTRGFMVFNLVSVPIGFLMSPSWVSGAIGVLLCFGALVQLVFQWAVYS
jgi:hypothetical protein